MKRNPYAPPTAHVADVSVDTPPTEIDRNVLRASNLLWWSFGASCLGSVFRFLRPADSPALPFGGPIGISIGLAVGLLITWWMVSKLRAGRNWMRLLFTIGVLAGIALIPLYWSVYKGILMQYANNPLQGILAGIGWILTLSTVVLLNTPSARSWFAAMKRGAA